MYTQSRFILFYSRNSYNIIKQLYSNRKKKDPTKRESYFPFLNLCGFKLVLTGRIQ